MGPSDLEHAPPRTPPPKRSGQRRREAHEEKIAQAQAKSFNEVLRGVGAMKEHNEMEHRAAAKEKARLLKLDKIRDKVASRHKSQSTGGGGQRLPGVPL